MLGIAFSIPLLFTVGYFAYKKPIFAIVIIIASLPVFLIRWTPLGLPINTLDLMIAIAFGVWVITHAPRFFQLAKSHSTPIIFLLIWFIVASASIFFAPSPVDALGILKSYFILPIAFIILMFGEVKTKQDIKFVLLSLSLLVFYNSFFTIVQKISPGGLFGLNPIPNAYWSSPDTFRATGLLQYPNALGLLIAPLIPILLGGIPMISQRYKKLFLLTSTLFGIVAILFSGSKGALIGLIVAFVILLLYIFKHHWKVLSIATVLTILLAIPYLDVLVSKVGLSSYSAQLRLSGWKEALLLLGDKPIVGAGLAGFQISVAPYHANDFLEIFLYPHNIFLNFWVELGIAGLIVFFILMGITLTKSYTLFSTHSVRKKTLLLSGILSLIVLFIHGLVDVPFFKNDLSVLFLFIWAWPFILEPITIRR